jgi:hypothetical protein
MPSQRIHVLRSIAAVNSSCFNPGWLEFYENHNSKLLCILFVLNFVLSYGMIARNSRLDRDAFPLNSTIDEDMSVSKLILNQDAPTSNLMFSQEYILHNSMLSYRVFASNSLLGQGCDHTTPCWAMERPSLIIFLCNYKLNSTSSELSVWVEPNTSKVMLDILGLD